MAETNSIQPDATPRYVRTRRLAWREIGNETVVVDLGRRRAHSLNESGSVLWHQLEQPRSVDELIAALGDESQSVETVRKEVTAFVDELSDTGLIRVVEPETPATPEAESSPSKAPYIPPRIAWTEGMQTCVLQGSCAYAPTFSNCESAPGGAFGS